ncbi:hypothetical protein [Rudaea sp.]|uniref:hypothetical protein n=1 Tax=Rudaea sp. TaxID=2136325 RepID=UPI002ED33632
MVHLRRREEGAYLLSLPRGCTEIALKSRRNLSVRSAKSFRYNDLRGGNAAIPNMKTAIGVPVPMAV